MASHFKGPILGSARSEFYGSEGIVENAPMGVIFDGSYRGYYTNYDLGTDYSGSLYTATTVGAVAGNSISVGTGILSVSGETVLAIDPGTANSTGYGSIQLSSGPGLFLDNEKRAWFVCRATLTDVSEGTAFVGLVRSDTSVLAADGSMDIADGLGFRIAAGDIRRIAERTGSTAEDTSTGKTASDNTFVNLSMAISAGTDQSAEATSGRADYYVNGVFVGSSGFIPDNRTSPLLLTMAVVNGASGTTDLRVAGIGFWGER